MDVAASALDKTISANLNAPRAPYFADDQVGNRLNAFEPFLQGGLKPPAYLSALRRSVFTWMPIQFAIRSKG